MQLLRERCARSVGVATIKSTPTNPHTRPTQNAPPPPLTLQQLSDGPGGAVHAEVTLDGTVYDLRSGAVVTWCPRDGSVVRSLLGALKEKAPPTPLKVYPVFVGSDNAVWARLSNV